MKARLPLLVALPVVAAACRLFVDLDGLGGGGGDASDAGSTPDAQGSGFCASADASVFCDSFDDGDSTFPAWTSKTVSNGGSLDLLADAAASPPGYLRAGAAPGDVNNAAAASLVYAVPVGRTTVTWSADVRIVARPQSGAARTGRSSCRWARAATSSARTTAAATRPSRRPRRSPPAAGTASRSTWTSRPRRSPSRSTAR